MADRATWAKRVAEWRASGLTSVAFCAGRGFTPGGLRNAAHLVERAEHAAAPRRVRVARVLRVAATEPVSAPAAQSSIIVELAGARVAVERGFDRDTLAAVVEVLASHGGRS